MALAITFQLQRFIRNVAAWSQTKMTKENLSAAERILGIQTKSGAPLSWGVGEHCACVANRVVEVLAERIDPMEAKQIKADLRALLLSDGLGGNSSQFRQSLVKAGKLPKSDAASPSSDPYADA